MRVQRFGFRVSGFGFRASGFEFRGSGFGFRVSRLWVRVSGLGKAPGLPLGERHDRLVLHREPQLRNAGERQAPSPSSF